MVETWEVARTTARRAIALLRDQGLVETVPQRGTYVR
jgi:DNA-binding GntR family transcriptional regulator